MFSIVLKSQELNEIPCTDTIFLLSTTVILRMGEKVKEFSSLGKKEEECLDVMKIKEKQTRGSLDFLKFKEEKSDK